MIDFTRLYESIDEYHSHYIGAEPFPVLCIDDFLTSDGIQRIRALRPDQVLATDEKSSDYIFAKNKHEANAFDRLGEAYADLKSDLLSDRFMEFLRRVTGEEVFVDPNFAGGGLHQGGDGSFLEMHADFSRHPAESSWIRELIFFYI